MPYYFPFGKPVRKLEQQDRNPKQYFVLGVYASAVHARWLDLEDKQKVSALAVASEPEIFWRGDDQVASELIATIPIPRELGRLTLPDNSDNIFNGPSGKTLDEDFLTPLGVTRESTWLCDLLPESRLNNSQLRAIYRAYVPVMKQFDLPIPTVPLEPDRWSDETRRKQILLELSDSKAEVLVLLGDQPIKWFLYSFCNQWARLADFGQTINTYGQLQPVEFKEINRTIKVLPLAHPRQTGKLGRASKLWNDLHNEWKQARNLRL